MSRPGRRALVAALALIGAACTAAPATTATPTIDRTSATAPPATASSPPGRYRDYVFDDADRLAADVVYRTAAEAPGIGDAPSRDLMVNIWGPHGDTATKRPVLLWQFAGGYESGDRNQVSVFAVMTARRGYVTVAIDYRTNPQGADGPGEVEGAREDALAAVAWLKQHADEYRMDTSTIVGVGLSAGGMNSINMITMEPDPANVVLAGAVSLWGTNLGPPPRSGQPPIIMFSGETDEKVPYEPQVEFCEAYRAAGNTCEQTSYPGGHLIGDLNDVTEKAVDFVYREIVGPHGY